MKFQEILDMLKRQRPPEGTNSDLTEWELGQLRFLTRNPGMIEVDSKDLRCVLDELRRRRTDGWDANTAAEADAFQRIVIQGLGEKPGTLHERAGYPEALADEIIRRLS